MLYRKPWFVLAITLALTSQRSAVQAAAAVFGLVLVLLCAGLPAVAVSGDAVLTGSVAPAPANVDLSVEENLDWAKWGPRVSEFNHKSGVRQQVSNYTVIGGGVPKRYLKTKSSYSWSDGSPTVSGENVNDGVRIFERGGGFQIKIPADTTPRTLKLYVGAASVKGKVEATLSDGSTPPFMTFVDHVRGRTTAEITLNYRAASVGQTLTVNWTVERQYKRAGAVSLEAVALMGSLTRNDGPVTVPNVLGLTQANAESAIVAAGLTVGTVSTATSDTVPAGEVISQTPGGGTEVSQGSAVSLSVSSGPAPVTVPNVLGLTQANAESAIVAAGLTVGTVSTATSDSVPDGEVIGQTPGGGTEVSQGSAVDLSVSSGPAPVTVPNVVGMTQADAESAIVTARLSVGTITTASSDSVPDGEVIGQTPGGGTEVSQGSAVDLSVSSGPAPITVPNVVGSTQANAESAIVTARLSVGTITTASSDSVPDGEVISQTPTGGTAVSSGSAVNLTVSSGPATPLLSWVAPVSRADGTPLSLSEIAGFRVYSGLASDNLSLVADVNDGSATSHTVTGLSSGTHYFAVTTYDSSNNESGYSDIVSKTIP